MKTFKDFIFDCKLVEGEVHYYKGTLSGGKSPEDKLETKMKKLADIKKSNRTPSQQSRLQKLKKVSKDIPFRDRYYNDPDEDN